MKEYRVSNDQQYAVMKDTTDDVPGKFLEDLERKLRVDIVLLNEEVYKVALNAALNHCE